MEPPPRPSSSLFDVFLRLRPSSAGHARFLSVEEGEGTHPTHITIKPPSHDNRKRAIERFAFTQVFEEDARQMDLFHGTGMVPMIEGVLGAPGHHGRDGLLATLGVTGSGKVRHVVHTNTGEDVNPDIESHHSGNEVAARPRPDDTRRRLPGLRRAARAVFLWRPGLLLSGRGGRVGSAHVHCDCLPRLPVWRQSVGTLLFTSANSHTGRYPQR